MISDRTYYQKWQALNEQMHLQGFTWGSLQDKGDHHQYMLYDLYRMSEAEYNRIMQATADIGVILQKMALFLQNSPALYQDMYLPENTWPVLQLPSRLFSYLMRMDLIVSGDDIRIIEVNCDTPTGFVESAIGNRLACAEFGTVSPNRLEEALSEAFAKWADEYGITADDTVFFTSYHWHEEDRQTTEFIRKNSGLPHTEYLALQDLRVDEEGVFTKEGRSVRFLYRLYPLEYISQDKGKNGEPIGELFLQHIESGQVKLINPPSAFLCQAKTTMAVIWALHEVKHPLFTEAEHAIIERHFLPTYISPEPFTGQSYVQKPVWGREGGGVSVFGSDGQVRLEDRTPYYYNQPKIYQKYVEMPKTRVKTWDGDYQGSLLMGSFLIGGAPSGLFLRIGGEITGNLSMFLPLTVTKESFLM